MLNGGIYLIEIRGWLLAMGFPFRGGWGQLSRQAGECLGKYTLTPLSKMESFRRGATILGPYYRWPRSNHCPQYLAYAQRPVRQQHYMAQARYEVVDGNA